MVTLGRHGARCYTAQGVAAEVPGEDVVVRDTIGAGDVFCATLLDTLRGRGLLGADRRAALRAVAADDWAEILRRATRAAGITVSRDRGVGADECRAGRRLGQRLDRFGEVGDRPIALAGADVERQVELEAHERGVYDV